MHCFYVGMGDWSLMTYGYTHIAAWELIAPYILNSPLEFKFYL